MVEKLRESFKEILDENEWMDEKTKYAAKEKVHNLPLGVFVVSSYLTKAYVLYIYMQLIP